MQGEPVDTKRRRFTVDGSSFTGGVYFLNFFDNKFKPQYENEGFSALDMPGLDDEIEEQIERDGWKVEEVRPLI